MSMSNDASSPVLWPPIIYATAGVISGLLAWLAPLALPDASATVTWIGRIVGAAMIVAGALIARAGERRFATAGTAVRLDRPATLLVTDGIYRRTRNPMYLGLTLVLAGLGLLFWSAWFVIAAPIAVYAVIKLAIEREERYLTQRFGQPYLDYRQRTRRWL